MNFSPYTGVSPEFEYEGDINGSYGFIWGDGETDFIEINCEIPVSKEENDLIKPQNFQLYQNTPNPFNPETTIMFSIIENTTADLIIYNLKGQIVKSFIEYGKGEHSVVWNGDDDFSNNVSSGIYFYQLNVNGYPKATKKCLLLK